MDDNIRRKPDFNSTASGNTPSGKSVDDLLQAANLKQWNKLRRLLDENKTSAAPYDARTPQMEQVVLLVAREGTTELMQKLKDSGADITARGTSFSVAFYAGNKEMMRYLFNQDMTLYPPSVIAGLHGRRGSFPDVDMEKTISFYRQLVAEDAQKLGLYSAYVCPNKPSLDDLRAVPYGVKEQGLTVMHLLARTGDVEDIIGAAFREDKNPLTVEDLLLQDRDGVSVLAILAARGEEQKLVDARLWLHNPAAVKEVNEALKDLRAGVSIDSNVFESDLVFYRLKKKYDPARWSLTPKRPDKK